MKCWMLCVAMVACLCATGAHADAETDSIAAERSAANARLAAQERECRTRFVVAGCLDAARTEHRASITRLRQRQLKVDEARRHAAAGARRAAIAERAEAQQGRASDAAPTPPEPPRPRPQRGPAPRPAAGASARASSAVDAAADRAALAQRHQEKYEARARAARAHREAVERRNAQRAAHGKVAAPLAPASGASAPR